MKISPRETQIGFIGIGVMGKSMALHLMHAGKLNPTPKGRRGKKIVISRGLSQNHTNRIKFTKRGQHI